MIQALHFQVAGRARFKVEGLRYSEPLKKLLEHRLARQEDILNVSASTLTGNILVNFNSNSSHKSVAFLIEGVLDEFHNGAAVIDAQFHRPEAFSAALDPVKKTRSPSRPVSNETVKRFLAPATQQSSKPWHTLATDTVLHLMRSDRQLGIDSRVAQNRLHENGPNKLQETEPRSGE